MGRRSWDNIGVCNLGEVQEFPLKDWAEFDKLTIPNIRDPKCWGNLPAAREKAGDKFLLASGISIYERVHFIRGLENTWMDIYDNPEELGRLIDILVDMNLYAIEQYAKAGADGLIFCDDWGLQNRLMISPAKWCGATIWKPRYAPDSTMLPTRPACSPSCIPAATSSISSMTSSRSA